jgi:hypothetical protein
MLECEFIQKPKIKWYIKLLHPFQYMKLLRQIKTQNNLAIDNLFKNLFKH